MILIKNNGKYILEAKSDDAKKMVELFIKRNMKKIISDLETIYDYEISTIHIKSFKGETNTGFFMYSTNDNKINVGYDDENGYKLTIDNHQIIYNNNGKILIRT